MKHLLDIENLNFFPLGIVMPIKACERNLAQQAASQGVYQIGEV
jgi:hypothetical protein